MKVLLSALCIFLVSTMVCAQTLPGGFITIKEDQIVWKAAENGVKQATLFGDPNKPGIYVVRNFFPAGVMSAPHSHDQDRFITVIRGTWYTGIGPEWNPEHNVPLPAGSVMFHPANAIHFDGAMTADTEVQVIGMGPVETTWVYPKEGRFGKPHEVAK